MCHAVGVYEFFYYSVFYLDYIFPAIISRSIDNIYSDCTYFYMRRGNLFNVTPINFITAYFILFAICLGILIQVNASKIFADKTSYYYRPLITHVNKILNIPAVFQDKRFTHFLLHKKWFTQYYYSNCILQTACLFVAFAKAGLLSAYLMRS